MREKNRPKDQLIVTLKGLGTHIGQTIMREVLLLIGGRKKIIQVTVLEIPSLVVPAS